MARALGDPVNIVSRVVEFLKTPNRAHFVVWVGATALLFSPPDWLQAMHLVEIEEKVGPYVGAVFFLLSVQFVVVLGQGGWVRWRASRSAARQRLRSMERLLALTPTEVKILRLFIGEQRRGHMLSYQSADVRALQAAGILVPATGIVEANRDPVSGEVAACTDYLLQPWVWEQLNETPGVLGLEWVERDGRKHLADIRPR